MKKAISLFTAILLFGTLFFNLNISAVEVSDIQLSYNRSGKWNDFSGKTIFSDYIDCIRIQTASNKDYYLSYKTWNEGKNGYYPAVKSNVLDSEEYAGSSGKRIRNINISVCDKDGNPIQEGIVVMYRAYVDGVWLPWVSNANSDWMSYVQRKYKLDGVLDTGSGNAGINSSYIQGFEIRIFEESNIDDTKGAKGKTKLINAPLLSQLNSYPTGCESVSAVMALKHNGLDISVDNFIDSYLEMGPADNFDPNICFGGNPRSDSGVGCYAPVIEAAADTALKDSKMTATLTSELSLQQLCDEYIDNGVPVIVWATIDMQKAVTGIKITYEGRTIQWISPEHCLLLVGYDEDNYIFNDPKKPDAVTYYSRAESENAFCSLGCQAVVIQYKPLPDKNFSLAKTSYTYNGKVRTPTVTVKDTGGNKLIENTDYTVSYASGRKNAGTYKVTVKMKGKYSGSKKLSFKINPISISKGTAELSSTEYTYNGKEKTPSVTVKNANGTKLTKGTHYTVAYSSGRKDIGKYKVTIKMKGNYSGTKTLYYTINPPKSSISKLTAGIKSLKVKVAKQTNVISGYQIQYSTSKKFTDAKTKTVAGYKSTSVTLKNLSANKKYYVRVRTYKWVDGKKLYSSWSAYKYSKTN